MPSHDENPADIRISLPHNENLPSDSHLMVYIRFHFRQLLNIGVGVQVHSLDTDDHIAEVTITRVPDNLRHRIGDALQHGGMRQSNNTDPRADTVELFLPTPSIDSDE